MMKDRPPRLDADRTPTPVRAHWEDEPIIKAPGSFTVEHEYKPVIYLPNGKVLVRRAGF